MSHTVTLKTQFKDPGLLAKACEAIGVNAPEHGEHRFMDGKTRTGQIVRFYQGYSGVLVIDDEGVAHYDQDMPMHRINGLKDQYAIASIHEVAGPEYLIQQTRQDDGSIRLVLSA